MIGEDEDEDVYCTMVVAGADSNVLIYEYDGRNMILKSYTTYHTSLKNNNIILLVSSLVLPSRLF